MKWRYTARDLITGEEIPLDTGSTGNRSAVRMESIAPDARRLRVSFPDRAASLIEVTAHAVVTDAYGTKSELKELIYDHELSDADPKRLKASVVALLERLAGVEPARGIGRSFPIGTLRRRHWQRRCANAGSECSMRWSAKSPTIAPYR